jgi:hypothetical protein
MGSNSAAIFQTEGTSMEVQNEDKKRTTRNDKKRDWRESAKDIGLLLASAAGMAFVGGLATAAGNSAYRRLAGRLGSAGAGSDGVLEFKRRAL